MFRLFSQKRIHGFPKIKGVITYSQIAVSNRYKDEGLASFDFGNKKHDIDLSSEFKLVRAIFPTVLEDVLNEQLRHHRHLPELRERNIRLIDYTANMQDRYLTTAVLLINSYKTFEKPSLLTEEGIKRAAILGWCLRLQESSLIIYDDIVDNATQRYRKPTWHSLPNNGKDKGILDAVFLEAAASFLLLKHFRFHPQLANIHRELVRNHSSCCLSYQAELLSSKFNEFEKFESVSKLYPLSVPIGLLAMYLANIDDQKLHASAFEVLEYIARILKLEDDMDSAYGDTEEDQTDERDGRPTWLAIQVCKNGTDAQKKAFVENYGKDDPECISKIYDIYKEMDIKGRFYEYRNQFYEDACKKIEALPKELPRTPFLNILNFAISGRMKT